MLSARFAVVRKLFASLVSPVVFVYKTIRYFCCVLRGFLLFHYTMRIKTIETLAENIVFALQFKRYEQVMPYLTELIEIVIHALRDRD